MPLQIGGADLLNREVESPQLAINVYIDKRIFRRWQTHRFRQLVSEIFPHIRGVAVIVVEIDFFESG
ncbi:hypothetical protein D3C77_387260 [compost metagenome]